LSETFLIVRRIEGDTIQHVYLSLKYLLFLSAFDENYFLDIFSKNTQLSNFMEILPVRAELFHADGRMGDRQTDMVQDEVHPRTDHENPEREYIYI
jgi:hypothetical protein